MNILLFNEQTDLPIDLSSVERVVEHVLNAERVYPDELAIYFVTNEEMCALHEEFFDDSSPTDCISFPIDNSFLGEVFVCPQTAKERLISHTTEVLADAYQETTLYLVHGLLHLMGYKDLTSEDRKKMVTRQTHLINQLIQQTTLIQSP